MMWPVVLFASFVTLKVAPCEKVAAAVAEPQHKELGSEDYQSIYFNSDKLDLSKIENFDQQLFDAIHKRFYQSFRRKLPSDIIEETILWAYLRAATDYKSDGSVKFTTYFQRIARNAMLNRSAHFRWRLDQTLHSSPKIFEDLRAPKENSINRLANLELDEEQRSLMYTALTLIKPLYSKILEMRYIRGFSMSDTAVILGIPIGTVKSQGFLALKALEKQIAELIFLSSLRQRAESTD
jgi:RNA polymerase sigma factor (sigma-70 family)